MPYAAFEQDREYLFGKFRNPVFDPSTGLDTETVPDPIMPLP